MTHNSSSQTKSNLKSKRSLEDSSDKEPAIKLERFWQEASHLEESS